MFFDNENSNEHTRTSYLSEENDDVETYTLAQVMNILSVSKSTVYNLAKANSITAFNYIIDSKRTKLFTRDSVDLYKSTRDSFKTVKKFAAQHKITPNHVFSLLNYNKIPYEINNTFFTRPTAILSDAAIDQLNGLLDKLNQKHSLKQKSNFTNMGFALFQPFVTKDGQKIRLSYQENKTSKHWGFFNEGLFIPIDQALLEGYTPLYDLPKINSTNRISHYSKFECSMSDEQTYLFIDVLYNHVSIKDLFLSKIENDKVAIYLKAASYPLSIFTEKLDLEWLKLQVTEGRLSVIDNALVMTGRQKVQTYIINTDNAELIEQYAREHNLSLSDVLNMAIELFKEKNKK